MKSRIRTRKKSPREQTPDFSTAPAQPMFQSRPFVVQSQQAEQSQKPDLKTSLMRAKRYGHHLSRIRSAGDSPTPGVQPKQAMGQPLPTKGEQAPVALQAKRKGVQRRNGNREVGNLNETKIGADGQTIQRRLSGNETDEAKKKRKIETQKAVNEAWYRANPQQDDRLGAPVKGKKAADASSIEAIVFSDIKGEIHRVEPIDKEKLPKNSMNKPQRPKTDKAFIRNNQNEPGTERRVSNKIPSKDGEMYIIDKLNVYFEENLFSDKQVALRKKEEAKEENLRIELVGPRGTCEDCQVALKAWLRENLQERAEKAGIGKKVSFSLATRYLPEKEGATNPNARLGDGAEALEMGSMYGHSLAEHKPEGIRKARGEIRKPNGEKEFPTEHYRLKYKSKQHETGEGEKGASNQQKPSDVEQKDEGFITVTNKRNKKKKPR